MNKYIQLTLFELPFDSERCYHYGDLENNFYIYSVTNGSKYELHIINNNVDRVIKIFDKEQEMFDYIIETYKAIIYK